MSTKKPGKIITFYSYKGGVGRTMALANVAFLAAMNGKRVLVMDWDLEAPGLVYYFRGLIEAADAKLFKDDPGILDILWEWSSQLSSITTQQELDSIIENLDTDCRFEHVVRSLFSSEQFNTEGSLNYIGAGSRNISTPKTLPYEEALAAFSWTKFYDEHGGGLLLESFKNWAKENYDLVLIDSRTGLADVAGICTIQLPDIVALCFVLNRQNIDGASRVAAAIRVKRNNEVAVRAVPMRVSRRDTSEESDAKARAISELTRIGGFSVGSVLQDIELLSIAADDNVPFYETLSPFIAADPTLDPLTLNYMRLATNLTNFELEVPEINRELIDIVRRRLLPKKATAEYMSKLSTMEPERAVAELQHLLESALEAELEGEEQDIDYISALINTTETIDGITDDPFQAVALRSKSLDLLRMVSLNKPDIWKNLLLVKLETFLATYGFMFEREDELSLLEEIDSLYSEMNTITSKLRRVMYRRKAARLYVLSLELDAAMQTVGEIRSVLHDIAGIANIPEDQQTELLASQIDVILLEGDVNIAKLEFPHAYGLFQLGLELLSSEMASTKSDELNRLAFELHSRMSEGPIPIVSNADAANHALKATFKSGSSNLLMLRFQNLARAVMRDPENLDIALSFSSNVFGTADVRLRTNMANYYGRSPAMAVGFLKVLTDLVVFITPSGRFELLNEIGKKAAECASQIVRNLERRRKTFGDKQRLSISEQLNALNVALANVGVYLDLYASTNDIRTPVIGSRGYIGRNGPDTSS
jgi:cellulose biosynthesis protein BcsQ